MESEREEREREREREREIGYDQRHFEFKKIS